MNGVSYYVDRTMAILTLTLTLALALTLTLTLTTGTLLLRARSGYKGNLKIGYTPRYKWTKQHARLVGEVPVGVDFGTVIETGAVSL